MKRRECLREAELLNLMRAGQWPDCCSDDLGVHITACAQCAEVVATAAALIADHDEALKDVHVPPSGMMWWRTQRRMRQEAERKAMRVVTGVQALFVIVAVVIAATFLGALSIDWKSLLQWSLPLIVAGAACVTLAPIAIYFAVAKD
jgi:hypothetical protein